MKERIIKRIERLRDVELTDLDNYIDFIEYKRLGYVSEERKKIDGILEVNQTNFHFLKKEIMNLPKYQPTGSIFESTAIDYLSYSLKLEKKDAKLLLTHMFKSRLLVQTSANNIRGED